MKKKIIVLLLACVSVFTFVFISSFNKSSAAQAVKLDVETNALYEFEKTNNNSYVLNSSYKTNKFKTGNDKLATLTISGDISSKSWNGCQAFGVNGDSVALNITFDSEKFKDQTQNWFNESLENMTIDYYMNIKGIDTNGQSSSVLVLKSFDEGKTWSQVTDALKVSVENITFTPSGDDIGKGVLYRILVVKGAGYDYVSGTHNEGFWWWKQEVNDYSTYSEIMIQEFKFFIASDSKLIRICSKDINNTKDVYEGASGEQLELISKGITLEEGSISLTPITVDNYGNDSYTLMCSYNGRGFEIIKNGQTFSKPGKYSFKVISAFGSERNTTVYIIDPKDDLGFKQYFGEGFLSESKRMFNDQMQIPVYHSGTLYSALVSNYYPKLNGSILYYKDEEAVKADNANKLITFDDNTTYIGGSLKDEGYYCADFYIGRAENSGSVIHYSFSWFISNDSYKPELNERLLKSNIRNLNYVTTMYCVNFQTAGGGSYVFCFPNTNKGYSEALSFAESIENRFVESYDSYWYYKSSDYKSSGLKSKYTSKKELMAAIREFALGNVSINHTIASDLYGKMTLDEAVCHIEDTSIKNDVFVCNTEDNRTNLLSNSRPIINGFKFTQVADYEVSSVKAVTPNGNVVEVPFDVDVSTIFNQTGVYTIIEKNWGGENIYEVVYFNENDNSSAVKIKYHYNFEEKTIDISKDKCDALVVNDFGIVEALDVLDPETIVTVNYKGIVKSMSLNEACNYTEKEIGQYTVTLTNRMGYEYSFKITIVEAPKVKVKFNDTSVSPVSCEYGVVPSLPKASKYGYVFIKWVDMIGNDITPELFTKTEVLLQPVYLPTKVNIVYKGVNFEKTQDVAFGTIIKPIVGNDYCGYTFDHWELNGSKVDWVEANTVEDIVLNAVYSFTSIDGKKVYIKQNEINDVVVKIKLKSGEYSINQQLEGSLIEANQFSFVGSSSSFSKLEMIVVEHDGKVVKLNEITLSSYVFKEYGAYRITVVAENGSSYSFIISIVKEPKITLVFCDTDIKSMEIEKGQMPELPKATKYGYRFIKWVDADKNDVNAATFEKDLVKLYPVFESIDVDVVVITRDGISNKTVKFGSVINLDSISGYDNYDFIGWLCNGKYVNQITISSIDKYTIEAQYRQITNAGDSIVEIDYEETTQSEPKIEVTTNNIEEHLKNVTESLEEGETNERKGGGFWIIIVIIILAIILLAIIL